MKLAFSIAARYFISGNKRSFINVISIISMLTLSVGTCALFVVLSVFNGLNFLVSNVHESFDAQLEIVPARGKVFYFSDSLRQSITALKEIDLITEVLEDDAFVNYKEVQKVVRVKGVSSNYASQNKLEEYLSSGSLELQDSHGKHLAIIGKGIQYELHVNLSDFMNPLQLWYPKRKNKTIRDESSFNRINIKPGGVFEIERQYDDVYMFVPLSDVERLFDYQGERSSLELKLIESADRSRVQKDLQNRLGDQFKVQTTQEKHSSLYKAIKIEKLIAFVIFIFILSIAAINIFLTMSMIVLNKRKEIAILRTLGASANLVRNVFLAEGIIIGAIGSLSGILLGMLLVYLQETYGFYGMHIQSAITESFPVRMEWVDVFSTALITFIITLLIALRPAIGAKKIKLEEWL